MTRKAVGDVTSTPTLTVSAAASGMLEAGFNSIGGGEDCHPAGIVTSTDAVRVAAAAPADGATVGEYLPTDVAAVGPDDSAAAVAHRPVEADVSHPPVIGADGNGLGTLTATDLTEALSAARDGGG